jgi:hypothetical protein
VKNVDDDTKPIYSVGHPLWRENAYGLNGLLLATKYRGTSLETDVHGLAKILGLTPRQTRKILARWVAMDGPLCSPGKGAIIHFTFPA